jgi:endonuclease/exonuclease/phosphatase family metal-dependent hydrolase
MTWNVGRFYTPTGNNRLDDHDIPRVANVLHELDPDCVLLQELVDVLQLRALLVRTHGEYVGALAERCGYDRKCAVLVKKQHQPEFEQHLLSPSSRGTVLARFQHNGVRMAAMSVHFDVFNRRRRKAQAEAVTQLAGGRDEDVVLVAGDFNFDPRWAADEDVETWSMLTSRLADSGEGIGPTLMGLLRIDHVLVRGGRTHSRVVSQRRLPLGDHDAVVCDVELPVREATRLRLAVG